MNRQLAAVLVCITFVYLPGCVGSGSGSNTVDNGSNRSGEEGTPQFNSAILDASDYDNYTYFNLDTGEALSLSAAEAATSTDWHIGLRRYGVILNGGDSGPGNVKGAIAATQADFYLDDEPNDSVFLNATAASELEHLLASYDASALSFVADTKSAAISAPETMNGTNIDMGWFNYNVATHAITLNDQNWWLLRSSAGDSYAIFHATSLSYDSTDGLSVNFEFDVQPKDVDTFTSNATFEASIPAAGGENCFDFDSDTTVACDDANWDLKLEVVGRNWNLWVNGGISGNGNGGAFGHLEDAVAATYTSATTSPTGESIAFLYSADASAGIFESSPWYEYDLEGRHQLWPNYRVYLIDTDSSNEDAAQYALQITTYYADNGVSGFPRIRYVEQ